MSRKPDVSSIIDSMRDDLVLLEEALNEKDVEIDGLEHEIRDLNDQIAGHECPECTLPHA